MTIRSCLRMLLFVYLLGPGTNFALAQGVDGSADRELDVLHALIVADTIDINNPPDKNIGASVAADARNVENLLRAAIPESRCKISVLKGDRVKRANILEYYRNVNAGKNDGLLFYFAGHGGFPTPKEHVLQLHQEQIRRAEVIGAMQEKGTGLVAVLTDCCSSYPTRGLKRGSEENPIVFASQPTVVPPGYRQLFFRTRGLIDVTAADDGEPADGDVSQGGIFTRALRLSLEANRNEKELTWRIFYSQLKKKTMDVAKEGGTPANGKLQSSRAFHLPGITWGFAVDGALRTVEVHYGSPAERAGLRVNDRVLGVDDVAVRTKAEYVQAMNGKGNTMTLWVQAGGEKRPLRLERVDASK